MNINLVLPYENTEKELFIWAYEEKQIDFRKERFRATRCTVAYAAVELIKYLTKLSCQVTYTEHVAADVVNVFLEAQSEEYEEDEFFMIPVSEGLKIVGKGRVGVLYGAYEFLRMQGIR